MDKYLKNKKIALHSKSDIEFHEILLDKLAQKREEEMVGISEQKIEKPILNKISFNLLLFVFLLFFGLFVKTFYLQIIQGENFSVLAERNKFIIHQIQAKRGVIYDQALNQLVFNQPSFDLILNIEELPQNRDKRLKILRDVSEITGKDIEIIKEKIKKADLSQVLILENLSHQELILLEVRINELTGFKIQKNVIRRYKDGKVFSHLIGYTGKITTEELRTRQGYTIFDWIGRKGIEKYYEDILRKTPGELRVKRNAFSNIISEQVVSLPRPGKSLVLWLNSDLQKKITQELQKVIKSTGSEAGVAIALDPRTGGVLSLVSWPNFDNNLFQGGKENTEALKELLNNPLKPLFNRVISGQYVSGSTIKPFLAAAAIEEGLITTDTQIFSDGKIEIPHRYDPDIIYTFRDVLRYGHGWTNVKKAIAESVNTFFYAIGGGYRNQRGLGPNRMKRYLKMFGWGQKTGIDLPGEEMGLLPSPSWKRKVRGMSWRLGDSYLFSIGQGNVLVTPLQLAVSTLAIANKGKILEPQVVKKIVSIEPDGSLKTEKKMTPKIINQDFINSETIEIVKQGMRQAVFNGTARMLNDLPVKVAAKTGTAETPREGYYHRWITLFAPYDNPEIVLTIMIESTRGDQVVIIPAAKIILDWYFNFKINNL
jgi:penicillin-binding protein 2